MKRRVNDITEFLEYVIYETVNINLIYIIFYHLYLIIQFHIDGLVQYCSNSIASALELLQSCTKLSICILIMYFMVYCKLVLATSKICNQWVWMVFVMTANNDNW